MQNPDEKIIAEEVTNQAGIGVFHIKLILISGLIWMARGFEMVVIRFVTPFLPCAWKLTDYHGALLNTVTLLSTMLGCFLYGIWSDKYGRRMAFYSLLILFIFGAASAVMPNFNLFLIFRAVARFSVGGFYQTLVLCCELFPGRKRGQVIYTLSTFWILGVIVMQHILYSTMARGHGWRLFVFVGTLPSLIAFCLIKFYPESFRYQMVKGQYVAADDIVGEMLKGSSQKVTVQLLQLPPMRRRRKLRAPFMKYSICLCILGLWTSICYWSLVYITDGADGIDFKEYIYPKVNEYEKNLNRNANFMYRMNEGILCVESMHLEEFKYITWTTALDFPAFVIYLIVSDWIDRKILLTASYVLSILFFFVIMGVVLLDVYMASNDFNPIYYYVFYYGARTLLLGQYDLLLLIVVETFPTSHRGMAVGLEVAMFHLGQLLGSYLGLSLIIPYFLFAYNILTFVCSLVCYCVLEETRGKELKDIIEKPSDENIEDN